MTLDDDLVRSGRAIATATRGDVIAVGALRARRRRGRVIGALLAVVALAGGIGVVASPGDGDGRVVDTVDDGSLRVLEAGVGPSSMVAAGGEQLGSLTGTAPTASSDPVVDRVLDELLDDRFITDQLAALGVTGDRDARASFLADAGLVIETSIRADALDVARQSAVETTTNGTASALVSVDPATGEIVALAGPTSLLQRQPGQAIMPIVMAAALIGGVGPDEEIPAPAQFSTGGPAPWQVADLRGEDHGTLTLGEALAKSANTPWAVLVDQGRLRPENVADLADRLGLVVPTSMRTIPTLVLGVSEVNPIDLAGAYATFATAGRAVDLHAVRRILGPGGDVLYDATARPTPAAPLLDPAAALVVRDAMEQAICCGTGTQASLGPGVAEFGNAGTTGSQADGWFAGSTPALTTVVWVGKMDPAAAGPGITSGGAPAEAWKSFMSRVEGAMEGTFPR